MQLRFNKNEQTDETEKARKVLHEWWENLKEYEKGDRAELRRCGDMTEIVLVPAYHDLFNRLRRFNPIPGQLAPIAGLSAHVKNLLADKNFATQMASPKATGGEPLLSNLRFRRLLACSERPELFQSLRRVIQLLDGNVNLYDLADSVYYWGDNVRQRWACDYYGELEKNAPK